MAIHEWIKFGIAEKRYSVCHHLVNPDKTALACRTASCQRCDLIQFTGHYFLFPCSPSLSLLTGFTHSRIENRLDRVSAQRDKSLSILRHIHGVSRHVQPRACNLFFFLFLRFLCYRILFHSYHENGQIVMSNRRQTANLVVTPVISSSRLCWNFLFAFNRLAPAYNLFSCGGEIYLL